LFELGASRRHRRLPIESADDLRAVPFAIKALPDASRFSATSARTASSAFESLRIVSDAVTPLPVTSSFLLDRDERKTAAMDELKRLASGHTFFLPFREIENAFLQADLIHAALAERAAQLELVAPDLADVQAALGREVNNVNDPQLYRKTPPGANPNTKFVVGSEVLDRLYWQFLKARYDKVADGKRLAELAIELNPEQLHALGDALRSAVGVQSSSAQRSSPGHPVPPPLR
jgi:hypothetical protein